MRKYDLVLLDTVTVLFKPALMVEALLSFMGFYLFMVLMLRNCIQVEIKADEYMPREYTGQQDNKENRVTMSNTTVT